MYGSPYRYFLEGVGSVYSLSVGLTTDWSWGVTLSIHSYPTLIAMLLDTHSLYVISIISDWNKSLFSFFQRFEVYSFYIDVYKYKIRVQFNTVKSTVFLYKLYVYKIWELAFYLTYIICKWADDVHLSLIHI